MEWGSRSGSRRRVAHALLDLVLVELALLHLGEVPGDDVLSGRRHDRVLLLPLAHVEPAARAQCGSAAEHVKCSETRDPRPRGPEGPLREMDGLTSPA